LITEYQAKLFAHELSILQTGESVDRLSHAMFDACIDLNPHQINAAIFALKNPLSKGCILADEVGLGKTIETGLVLSQLWAEGKRSFLIIAPKSLRHQWKDELSNLFFLESEILSGQDFKQLKNTNGSGYFGKKEKIIITNEHSVDTYHEIIKSEQWDLVVIDEAHKLRNVWRKGNSEAKRAKRIKDTIKPFKKLLLTATPMQNNLMELYGLTSFIDDYILGSRESFQSLFCNLGETEREQRSLDLKNRMKTFFRRELRKNVLEYINYTNRNAITFTYDPTDNEEELRIKFENFLRKEVLISIPASALPLLKLVYLKLIASSTFAIKNSLLNLYKRLVLASVSIGDQSLYDELFNNIRNQLLDEHGKKTDHLERFEKLLFKDVVHKTYDGLRQMLGTQDPLRTISEEELELADNYPDQEDKDELQESSLNSPDLVKEEAAVILEMIVLSLKIEQNKKADALVEAITQQFEKARQVGWPEKAVIFTEFRSTQDYILKKLSEMGIDVGNDVVIFNGDSGDAESRRELVKSFKGSKKIFLTTEAGSEGLNLQFCNLIINYDLPWNPQRIEQRIGRCHRYGQKLDVVVVNFVNIKNPADMRVLELLQEKFNLFKGAFGASDEVLGSIEDGHDVEKDILNIYLSCRTPEEIDLAFKELQEKSSNEISTKLQETRQTVLEEFDEDVHSRLKLQLEEAEKRIDLFSKMFWSVTQYVLGDNARFDTKDYTFNLVESPGGGIEKGLYKLGQYKMIGKGHERSEDSFTYRLGHPLGSLVIEKAKSLELPIAEVIFDLTNHENKISSLDGYVGKSGWLKVNLVGVESLDSTQELLYMAVDSEGIEVNKETIKKMLSLASKVVSHNPECDSRAIERLESLNENELTSYLKKLEERNARFFNDENEKLDKWSEDVKEGLEVEIKEIDKEINKLKKELKSITVLDEKVKAQRDIKNLEKKRNDKRKNLFEEQDRIEAEKERLLAEIEKRMSLNHKQDEILKIKWKVI
jgi:ERCC4-related helicase